MPERVDPSRRYGDMTPPTGTPGDGVVVCACVGLTYGPLRAAIAGGAATLDAIQACTGAGAECGSCLPALERMVGGGKWRRVRVDRFPIADGIYQLWLSLRDGTSPSSRPGQYLRVRVRIGDEWKVRAYTITSVGTDGDVSAFEITVKRMPHGVVSNWLADQPMDDLEVEISAPRGSFCWAADGQPAVCLVAGIGVTPALAFARHAASIRCPPGLLHIDYSVRAEAQVVAPHELHAYAEAGCLSLRIRTTGQRGRLTQAAVRELVDSRPGARFFVCGPPGYLERVVRWLMAANVAASRIQIEDFAGPVSSVTASVDAIPGFVAPPRARPRAYLAGLLAAAAASIALAVPATSQIHAKGPANTGHDTLECADCHRPAPGTTRQQLQGRVRYVLGLRTTAVDVGHVPVDNDTCFACHDNPDDRHPIHRFGEPRFDEVRRELGVDRCLSCHGEHEGGRVTVDSGGFCVGCHEETELEDDPVSPTHAELVADERWSTCLQCHDFHGNHLHHVPTWLVDGVPVEAVERYFDGGPSPYGADKRVVAKPRSEP